MNYAKISSVYPLNLIFSKVNGYFEWLNQSKYFTIVPTNESKEEIEKYEELWSKIRDLIRSVTKNWDDYDKKYMKIKLNSDDKLPLNKNIKISSMLIFVRAIFLENDEHYAQVFLNDCLYKL